ncbi:hypothetical protein MKX01_028947 [Papaver californicum]|nr:hypothetical protein MKX01_028947 [Papaver californicum]
MALEQFGTVKTVQFIPNYFELKIIPQCALVEMQTEKQVKVIICEMTNYPFMMRITCQWLERSDPDYEVTQKLKQLTLKHAEEASYLLRRCSRKITTNHKKLEMLENLFSDGSFWHLARRYNMKNVAEEIYF